MDLLVLVHGMLQTIHEGALPLLCLATASYIALGSVIPDGGSPADGALRRDPHVFVVVDGPGVQAWCADECAIGVAH